MSESPILAQVQLALAPHCRLFRNTIGICNCREHVIRYGGPTGSSDLLGWHISTGLFTAVEVKTQTGRVSPEQSSFINTVRAHGGIAFVARSPEQAVILLKQEVNRLTRHP